MKISKLIPQLNLLLEQGNDLNLCIDYEDIELDDFEIIDNILNISQISKNDII